ncbi:MAG: hypothetical protein ACYCW6_22830 [Candidatus Xenobia bacterium]
MPVLYVIAWAFSVLFAAVIFLGYIVLPTCLALSCGAAMVATWFSGARAVKEEQPVSPRLAAPRPLAATRGWFSPKKTKGWTVLRPTEPWKFPPS